MTLKKFLWGYIFVVTTLVFVHLVFPHRPYVLTLFCPTPIPTWYFLSNVYIMASHGQEMAVDMMESFAGHVLAVLWPYMHVILAAFSTPKVPTSFICSCFTFMLRNHFLVAMACSRVISTTRYVFYDSTIHHSILLIIGVSCHFLLQSTDLP